MKNCEKCGHPSDQHGQWGCLVMTNKTGDIVQDYVYGEFCPCTVSKEELRVKETARS